MVLDAPDLDLLPPRARPRRQTRHCGFPLKPLAPLSVCLFRSMG
jgi:hypothetical protein